MLFLKYGRDDELQADGWARGTKSTLGWDPAGVPGIAVDARTARRSGGRSPGRAELAVHASRSALARQGDPADGRAAEGRRRRPSPPIATRCGSASTASSTATTRSRASRAATRSCIRSLRFRIDFPDKWEIANSPQQVVAKAPGADVFMLLAGRAEAAGAEHPGDRAQRHEQRRLPRGAAASRTTINGLEAFVGVYQGQIEGLGPVTTRAAHILHGKDVYLVAGLVAPDAFQQADSAFSASIRSFRPLSAAEAEDIRPDRVDSTSCAPATPGSRSPSGRAARSSPRRWRS